MTEASTHPKPKFRHLSLRHLSLRHLSLRHWLGLCALGVLWLRPVGAQITTKTEIGRDFIGTPAAVEYQNHAFSPFRPFPVFGWEVPRYDRLGRYLMQGRVMISADEQRPGLSKFQGLRFERANVFAIGADFNYAVLQDSYKGRNYALMVLLGSEQAGQATSPIKTQFTPLTLNMTRYNGVRLDISGAKSKGSLIYSKGAGGRKRFSVFSILKASVEEQSPVFLWGGHWETQLGSALRLGSTFVNQHIMNTRSRQGSILKGDISNEMLPPELIAVRVVDDSPQDLSSPAAAYSVTVILKGVDEEDNEQILELEGTPGGGRRVGDHWEALGEEEQIEFIFELPDGFIPREAEFKAVVGGDYRIQVRQEYKHSFTRIIAGRERSATVSHQWPAEPRSAGLGVETSGFEFDAGDLRFPIDFKFPETQPAYTLARASGTPRDVEPREVRFDYGFPTAQNFASVDIHVDHAGLVLDGEVSMNAQHFKFPVADGRRTSKDAVAYYLTASRKLPLLGLLAPSLGVELFRIEPDYGGNFDAKRGGAIFHTSVPAAPPNTALTQEFDLFDDNDDGDQWPDNMPNDTALSGANDAGVYPGLDQNGDNVPDTDQNGNSIPDWDEPFLFFWSDPPQFIYDIDMNNNSLPDITENDDKPDYPYDRDSKGFHSFATWKNTVPHLEMLTLGVFRSKAISRGGENNARYLRFELAYRPRERGIVEFKGDVKQVKDSIPDPTFIWRTAVPTGASALLYPSGDPVIYDGGFDIRRVNSNVIQQPAALGGKLLGLRSVDADPMLMRNSTVSTLNIDADLEPVENLTIHSRYKWLLNRQHEDEFGDGSTQDDKTLSRLTLSSRVQYQYPLRERITLVARMRHLLWHDAGYSPATRQHWSTYGPLFEESFELTDRTVFVAGQEGIPFLVPIRHTDYDFEERDFKRWTNVFMMRITGQYIGWKTVSEIGLQLERVEMADAEVSNRTFFLEMFFGF